MENLQLLIPLLGALWASHGAGINATKILNEIRDRIYRGKDNLGVLTLEERNVLMNNDWVPQIIATTLLYTIFSTLIVSLPFLYETENKDWLTYGICFFSALYPIGGMIGYFIGGLSDYKKMKERLEKEAAKISEKE